MIRKNYVVMEAAEKIFNPSEYVAAFKKSLNVCKLSKYKSDKSCADFYSAFFMNNLNVTEPLTFDQWGVIYNNLLADESFVTDLGIFIAMYQPAQYTGIFEKLKDIVISESETATNKVRYLSNARAIITMMKSRLNAVGTTITAQTFDPNVTKFIMVMDGSLFTILSMINKFLSREIVKTDDTESTISIHQTTLSEDAEELINMFEASFNPLVKDYQDTYNEFINEGVVLAAKDKLLKLKRMEQDFNNRVARKWNQIKQERQTRKHAELVGESLRLTNEIKRILVSAPAAIINPGLPIIIWAVTLMIDRRTDLRDRNIMIRQLKDELEILEEKIRIAESKSDDKEKIELIRIRQKLTHEYERISKVKMKER